MKTLLRKILNMLIMLLTVSIILLYISQINYIIPVTIQDHQYIFAKILHQRPIVHTRILFLIKLVIHMTVRHELFMLKLFAG